MNIKIARIKKDLTQEQVCMMVGMSRTSLCKVEKGDFTPLRYETMIKLSLILSVGVQELFFNEENSVVN